MKKLLLLLTLLLLLGCEKEEVIPEPEVVFEISLLLKLFKKSIIVVSSSL